MLARLIVAGALLSFVTACSDLSRDRVAGRSTVPPDNPPPAIDPTQLAYDPDERTIHLYDLIADPKTGRKGTWEVRLTDQTIAYPTGRTFQVPRDVSESEVVIRAADPPSPPSAAVRLTDVPRKR